MLQNTKAKLDSMYKLEMQEGIYGLQHQLDGVTTISFEQGTVLATIHREMKPDVSLEIGMAYGFSTLFILDSMHEHKYGYHIAIDPFQKSLWHGIGIKAVEQLDFNLRFNMILDYSVSSIPQLYTYGVRPNYIYIDGDHRFDSVLVDFYLSHRILSQGGVIIFDDLWMPSIQKVVSFIRSNFSCYSEIQTPVENILCLQKSQHDHRKWDHFVDF